MSALAAALGVAILLLVVVDLLWTTLWVEGGAGPLTARFMTWSWRLHRRVGDRHRVLTLAGPLILTVGLGIWVSLLWLGWTLVFGGAETSLVDTVGDGPVSWIDRLYFTGYAMFTMGNGDFSPQGGVWQMTTALTTASGMLLVTLGVTYVLSVLDAVTQKRTVASTISGLGSRGEEIVRTGWEGDDFRCLEVPLTNVAAEINELTSNHKAYPILHYFHAERAGQAPTTSVAALDEALTVLEVGVAPRARPGEAPVRSARSSVTAYLDVLGDAFVDPATDAPPPPDLDVVREAGVPTVDDAAFANAVSDLAERRRALRGAVESDARQWPADETE